MLYRLRCFPEFVFTACARVGIFFSTSPFSSLPFVFCSRRETTETCQQQHPGYGGIMRGYHLTGAGGDYLDIYVIPLQGSGTLLEGVGGWEERRRWRKGWDIVWDYPEPKYHPSPSAQLCALTNHHHSWAWGLLETASIPQRRSTWKSLRTLTLSICSQPTVCKSAPIAGGLKFWGRARIHRREKTPPTQRWGIIIRIGCRPSSVAVVRSPCLCPYHLTHYSTRKQNKNISSPE